MSALIIDIKDSNLVSIIGTRTITSVDRIICVNPHNGTLKIKCDSLPVLKRHKNSKLYESLWSWQKFIGDNHY